MKRFKFNLDSEIWTRWLKKIKVDKAKLEGIKTKLDSQKLSSPKFRGSVLGLALVISGGIYIYSSNAQSYVLVNGETIGVVESVKSGKTLIADILEEKEDQLGAKVLTRDDIDFKRTFLGSAEVGLVTKEDLEQKLNIYAEGIEIRVGDRPIFVLPNQAEAERLLKSYQEVYAKADENNEIISISFEEEIETGEKEVSIEQITTHDEALEKLIEGDIEKVEYEIQEGDSWWLIARKHNLLTQEVLAANPGTTLDSIIKPGEKIMIETVRPYITVVCEGVKTDKEIIPFDVVTKTDASLASGKTKITQQGSDGEKEVKYSYVAKNDKIVDKTIIDEKVTKKPVDQIVAKGPKRTTVTVAYSRGSTKISGLTRPYGGRISSYYGYRGKEFHTGVDLSGSTGEPFVAAGSGKVVSAGWSGGYGNCIVIDHGNGIKTRYAHSSKLLVKVGQNVSRGQTIGLIGSTGRSSGPHLHFEIIVNGQTVNPLNYI